MQRFFGVDNLICPGDVVEYCLIKSDTSIMKSSIVTIDDCSDKAKYIVLENGVILHAKTHAVRKVEMYCTVKIWSYSNYIWFDADEVSEESKELPYKVIKDDNGNIKIKCSSLNKDFSVMRELCREFQPDDDVAESETEDEIFRLKFKTVLTHALYPPIAS
jgi:hypothetical protein